MGILNAIYNIKATITAYIYIIYLAILAYYQQIYQIAYSYASILTNNRAEAGKIIGIVIALLLAALLLPISLTEVYRTNTSGWNAAVATVYTVLLPLLAVIAIALIFFSKVRVK
jgi:hypothetical protein